MCFEFLKKKKQKKIYYCSNCKLFFYNKKQYKYHIKSSDCKSNIVKLYNGDL